MTTVVTVTYNSESTIEECLAGLLIHTDGLGEIICVDNASTDYTSRLVSRMAARDTRIKLVQNDHNSGYAPAANQGARMASGETIVFMNPDAVTYGPWLPPLEEALSNERVGAAGPLTDVVTGDMWVGHYVSDLVQDFSQLTQYVRRNFPGQTIETKLLVGFCVAMRRSLFEEVGGFDDNLVLGADDLDLSWRLRLAGYRLLVCKDSFVRHHCGVSFGSLDPEVKQRLSQQSDQRLKEKLIEHYGDLSQISSHELWGCEIFDGALARN